MAKNRIITSIITGDIIHSRRTDNAKWLSKLRKALSMEGKTPRSWEIYRGDSFQVEVKDPVEAFHTAIRIKATIKTIQKLDVRMAIGIGTKNFVGQKITESNGEAFINSGEQFESLKKVKQTLAIKTPWPEFDREMNIGFKLACIPMDEWSPSSAELVRLLTHHPGLTQKSLAKRLGVSQPSVSERRNRSHYDEIMELEGLCREKIAKLISSK